MAQIAKIDAQAEIKSSPDKFHGFFKNNITSFPQMFPQIFKSVEVVGGGALRAGAVFSCKYDLGEGPVTAKIKIPAVDDENTSINFVVLEGDVLKLYKTFKAKLEISKAGNGGSTVKWTLEVEKANANAPEPKLYADHAIKVSKGIDAYLGRA
ncbi:hypothetical protein ACFX2I_006720 [Malus domestica]|uniref:Bet v I/Major latex protein domain-containing protein n=1 Tax=Malus domestica TaxID=3750 RepID=A0A498IJZ5_MALDO|nr:MLP-like protein 423 [Malus domestica]XP_050112245.1 MLP-like protein 423 [Malus sylvestris]RXH83480.1 hypothetical protein DVH24_005733 [Malus domestica]